MRLHVVLVLVALLSVCGIADAAADEVRLKNGDRLSGEVVSLANGTLTFKTPHGNLAISWPEVIAIVVEQPIVVAASGRADETASLAASAAAGEALLAPGGTVPLASIDSLTRPQPRVIVDGSVNAGILQTSGNTDTNGMRLDGEAVIRTEDNRYTASGVINRAESLDVETARNASGTLRYDRFLTERLYVTASGIFTTDSFRDLDLRTALGAGVGYDVFDAGVLRFNIEGGYGYVDERFEIAPDTSFHSAREAASLELFIVGDRLTAFQRHDAFFGLEDRDDIFVKATQGVRVGLGGGLVATFRFDIEYDRSPAPGRRGTDRSVGLTFGYRF